MINFDWACGVVYIVTIKPEHQHELECTTCASCFCGTLENFNGSTMVFRLNGHGGIVIIPHGWIESMAPSKVHWELRRKEK